MSSRRRPPTTNTDHTRCCAGLFAFCCTSCGCCTDTAERSTDNQSHHTVELHHDRFNEDVNRHEHFQGGLVALMDVGNDDLGVDGGFLHTAPVRHPGRAAASLLPSAQPSDGIRGAAALDAGALLQSHVGGAVLTTAAHLALSLNDARRIRPNGYGGGGSLQGIDRIVLDNQHNVSLNVSDGPATTAMSAEFNTAETRERERGLEHGHLLHELRNRDREADGLLEKKLARERIRILVPGTGNIVISLLKFANSVTEREYVVYCYSSHRVVAFGYCAFAIAATVAGSVLLYRNIFRAGFGILAIVVIPWVVAGVGILVCRKRHLKLMRIQRLRSSHFHSDGTRIATNKDNGGDDDNSEGNSESDEDEEAEFSLQDSTGAQGPDKRKRTLQRDGSNNNRRRTGAQYHAKSTARNDVEDIDEEKDAWSLETKFLLEDDLSLPHAPIEVDDQLVNINNVGHRLNAKHKWLAAQQQRRQQKRLFQQSRTALRDNAMYHEALLIVVTIANFIFMFLLHGSKNDCHYLPVERRLMDCQAASQNEGITIAVFLANVFLTPIRSLRYCILAILAFIGYGVYFYKTSNRSDAPTFVVYYVSEMVVLGTHLLSTVILMFVYERWRRLQFESYVQRHQRALMVELAKKEAKRVISAAIPMGSVREVLDRMSTRRKKERQKKRRERRRRREEDEKHVKNIKYGNEDAQLRSHRANHHHHSRPGMSVHVGAVLFGYHQHTLVCVLSLEGFASWSAARGPCSTVQLLHPLVELLDDLRVGMLAPEALEASIAALQTRRQQQDEILLAKRGSGLMAGGGSTSVASRLSAASTGAAGGDAADGSQRTSSPLPLSPHSGASSSQLLTSMTKFHGLGDDYIFTITDSYGAIAARRAERNAAAQQHLKEQQEARHAAAAVANSRTSPPRHSTGSIVLASSAGDDVILRRDGAPLMVFVEPVGDDSAPQQQLSQHHLMAPGSTASFEVPLHPPTPTPSPSSPRQQLMAASLGPRGEVATVLLDFAMAACSLVNIGILELEGVVLEQHPLCTMPAATDRERSNAYDGNGVAVCGSQLPKAGESWSHHHEHLRAVEPLRMRAALDVGPCGGVVLSSSSRRHRSRRVQHQQGAKPSSSSSSSSGESDEGRDTDAYNDDVETTHTNASSRKSTSADTGVNGFRSWSAVGAAVDVCAMGIASQVVAATTATRDGADLIRGPENGSASDVAVRQNTKFLAAAIAAAAARTPPATSSDAVAKPAPSRRAPASNATQAHVVSVLPNTTDADEDSQSDTNMPTNHRGAPVAAARRPYQTDDDATNGAMLPAVFMSDRYFDLVADWLTEAAHDGILDHCFAPPSPGIAVHAQSSRDSLTSPTTLRSRPPAALPATVAPLHQLQLQQQRQQQQQQRTGGPPAQKSSLPPSELAAPDLPSSPAPTAAVVQARNVYEYDFPFRLYRVVNQHLNAMVVPNSSGASGAAGLTPAGKSSGTAPWHAASQRQPNTRHGIRGVEPDAGGDNNNVVRNPLGMPSLMHTPPTERLRVNTTAMADVMDTIVLVPSSGKVFVGVIDTTSNPPAPGDDALMHRDHNRDALRMPGDTRPILSARVHRKEAQVAAQMRFSNHSLTRRGSGPATGGGGGGGRQNGGHGMSLQSEVNLNSFASVDQVRNNASLRRARNNSLGTNDGEAPMGGGGGGGQPLSILVTQLQQPEEYRPASTSISGGTRTGTGTTTTTTNPTTALTGSASDVYEGFYVSTPREGHELAGHHHPLQQGHNMLPPLQRSLGSTSNRFGSLPASIADGGGGGLPLDSIDMLQVVDPQVAMLPKSPQQIGRGLPNVTESLLRSKAAVAGALVRHRGNLDVEDEDDPNDPNVRYRKQIASLRLAHRGLRILDTLLPATFVDARTELHYMITVLVDFESKQRQQALLIIASIAVLYVLCLVIVAAVGGSLDAAQGDDGVSPLSGTADGRKSTSDTVAFWTIITAVGCVGQLCSALFLRGVTLKRVQKLVKAVMAPPPMEVTANDSRKSPQHQIVAAPLAPYAALALEAKLVSPRLIVSFAFSLLTIGAYIVILFVADEGTYLGDSQIIWFLMVLSLSLQRPPIVRPVLMWVMVDIPICVAFFVRTFRNLPMTASLRNTSLFINAVAVLYCWMIRTLNDEAQRKVYRSDRRAAFVDDELTLQKKELLTALRLVAPQGAAIRLLRRAVLHNGFRGYAGLAAAGNNAAAAMLRGAQKMRHRDAADDGATKPVSTRHNRATSFLNDPAAEASMVAANHAEAAAGGRSRFKLWPDALRLKRFVTFMEDVVLGTNQESTQSRKKQQQRIIKDGDIGTRIGKVGASGFLPLVLTRCTGEMTDLPFLIVALSGSRKRSVESMFPKFVAPEEEEGGCRPSRSPVNTTAMPPPAGGFVGGVPLSGHVYPTGSTTAAPNISGRPASSTSEDKAAWLVEWDIVRQAHETVLSVVEEHRDFGVSIIRSSGYATIIACTAPAVAVTRSRKNPYGNDEELVRGPHKGSSSTEEASSLALLTVAIVIQEKLKALAKDPKFVNSASGGGSSTLSESHRVQRGAAGDASNLMLSSTTESRTTTASTTGNNSVVAQEQLDRFTTAGMSPAGAPSPLGEMNDNRRGKRNASGSRAAQQLGGGDSPLPPLAVTAAIIPNAIAAADAVFVSNSLPSPPDTPSREAPHTTTMRQSPQPQQFSTPAFLTHRMLMNVSPMLPAVLGSEGGGSAVFFDYFGPGISSALKVIEEVPWGTFYATDRAIGPALVHLLPLPKVWTCEMNAALAQHHREQQYSQRHEPSRSDSLHQAGVPTIAPANSAPALTWGGCPVPVRLQHTFRWIENLLHPPGRYVNRAGQLIDPTIGVAPHQQVATTATTVSMLDLHAPIVRHYLSYNERIRFADGLDAHLLWHMNDAQSSASDDDDDDDHGSHPIGDEDDDPTDERQLLLRQHHVTAAPQKPKRPKSCSYSARIGERRMFRVRGVEAFTMRHMEVSMAGDK